MRTAVLAGLSLCFPYASGAPETGVLAEDCAPYQSRVAGVLSASSDESRVLPKLCQLDAWVNSIGIRSRIMRGTHDEPRVSIPGREGVADDPALSART